MVSVNSNTNSVWRAGACEPPGNVSSKIIEPIQSRCAILRYVRLTDEQVLTRLLEVCKAEEVAYTEEGLEALIFTSEGDMRNALNST